MRSRLVVLTTLAALATGGGLAYFGRSGIAVAAAFGGGTAVLHSVNARRIGGGLVGCAGECRVFTAELDDWRPCSLKPAPQASFAACLTQLNSDCATSCKSNP